MSFLQLSPSIEGNADWLILKITEILSQPLTEETATQLADYNSAYTALKRWKKSDNNADYLRLQNEMDSDDTLNLTDKEAKDWVGNIVNADGSQGGHWTLEQAENIQAQRKISGVDPVSFWVALSSAYADYYNVAKKVGCNSLDFYVNMAMSFLNDPDANGFGNPRKRLGIYYRYIVKH